MSRGAFTGSVQTSSRRITSTRPKRRDCQSPGNARCRFSWPPEHSKLAQSENKARAYFAEGLSSSYEAFHHTKSARDEALETDEDDESDVLEARLPDDEADHDEPLVPLAWYEEHIAAVVPDRARAVECSEHPKLRAVVNRAIQLWESGEKVLVFCFYPQTAKALRDHLRSQLDAAIATLVINRLKPAVTTEPDAHEFLARVGRRFADAESPFAKQIAKMLSEKMDALELTFRPEDRTSIVEALAAYIRSPGFLSRYLPFEIPEVRAAPAEAESRSEVIQHGTEALQRSFTRITDSSGLTMHARVQEFLKFAAELQERDGKRVDDEDGEPQRATPSLLRQYLDSISVK